MAERNSSEITKPPLSAFQSELQDIDHQKKELEIREQQAIDKAVKSDNPTDIIKAMDVVKIKQNEGIDYRKSSIVDPFQFDQAFGYKASPNRLTYGTLWSMSHTNIISAIIKTRKTQVADFSQPQRDRYSTGFIIRKKGYFVEQENSLSKEDRARIDNMIEFMLNTGCDVSFSRHDFDTFLRLFTEDSLIYDQGTFEIVRNMQGGLHEFFATDATTMRIADSFSDKDYNGTERTAIGGYYPSYVQVLNNEVLAEFYPWELCFGTRNPTTRLYSNGYGRSELEDMVTLITSMLWSDTYNRNFFRQGAAPKGILRVKGGANNPRLQEFRQQWRAMASGVDNAWRTPVIDGESVEWIDLQKGHKDMEYSKWQEYLIKLSCAMYIIDPNEIGFPSGDSGGGGKPMFETGNAQRLKFSRDKGLKPLLKFIQTKINKYVISQIDPDLTFEFVGLDVETEEQYRKRIIDEVQYKKTVNEVRKDDNLPPLPHGDTLLNPSYAQEKQMAQMMGEGQVDENGQVTMFNDKEEAREKANEKKEKDAEKAIQANPFMQDFNSMIDEMNHE